VILVPSLWSNENFQDYILTPDEYSGHKFVSFALGIEGYNYFVPLQEINEVGDLPPFLRGNCTPREIFENNLDFLQRRLGGKVAFRVTEANSAYLQRRGDWLF